MLKKRVLFFIMNLNVGGTERALINMLEEMNNSLYDVEVRVLEKKGELLYELPSFVKLTQVEDYPELKKMIMSPPISVIKSLIFKSKFYTAFLLLISHTIFKLTNNRTLYYKNIISLMKKDFN
ncbi:hypothetical protein, partial [Thomasclavelia sp.]